MKPPTLRVPNKCCWTCEHKQRLDHHWHIDACRCSKYDWEITSGMFAICDDYETAGQYIYHSE